MFKVIDGFYVTSTVILKLKISLVMVDCIHQNGSLLVYKSLKQRVNSFPVPQMTVFTQLGFGIDVSRIHAIGLFSFFKCRYN